MEILNKLFREEIGVTSIEYALVAVLIAIAIVGAVTLVGERVEGLYDDVAGKVKNAFTGNQNG